MSDQKCIFCDGELSSSVRPGEVCRCDSHICIHSVAVFESIQKLYFKYSKKEAEERIDKIVMFFKDLYKDSEF